MDLFTVVLGPDLRVRSLTPARAGGFVPGSFGQTAEELARAWHDEMLAADAAAVLAGAAPRGATLQAPGGAALRRQVAALREEGSRIIGVVVTCWLAPAATSASQQEHFISVLSHDLRTPVGALTLWTRLLAQANNAPQTREAADMIHRSAEELREMIEHLSDTVRTASGRLRLELREFALLPVVLGAVESRRADAADRMVRLETKLDPSVGVVRGDPGRIHQLVENLVDNALKFTPSGGRIDVGLRRVADEVELQIVDSGEGIPAEILPRVFERAENDSATRGRGLGLGLRVVQQIVAHHRGAIAVASDGPGQGAAVTVRLPLPAVAVDSLPRPASGAFAGKQVALFGVSEEEQLELEPALQMAGAVVRRIERDAIGLAKTPPAGIDIFLCDLGNPGFDVIEWIRGLPPVPTEAVASPRFVALLGLAAKGSARRALQSGFSMVLCRPVVPERLAETLDALGSAPLVRSRSSLPVEPASGRG